MGDFLDKIHVLKLNMCKCFQQNQIHLKKTVINWTIFNLQKCTDHLRCQFSQFFL